MADRAACIAPVPAITSAKMREIDRIMVEAAAITVGELWLADISVAARAYAGLVSTPARCSLNPT